MENYISTKDKNFNAKLELENLLKKRGSHGFSKQEAGAMLNLTPKMLIAYEKEFVVTRVDDRTGRVYKFDTRTNKEYKKESLKFHPALQYHYEKNNIPLPGENNKSVNLADIKYLEARINYERALSYKNEGDIKTRGLRVKTYNDKVNADKKNNRFLEDGTTTIYEASYQGKLNALETEMNNYYADSSYFNKDLTALETTVETKVETETKENKEKNKVVVPVQRDERYLNMLKVQKELDETINKGENLKNRGVLNIGPKSVKTYDLRNLLQIEQ